MAAHKWRQRHTDQFGDVWFPIALVELWCRDNGFETFAFQVDSGAIVSLLRRSATDELGIELTEGQPISLSGVGGARTSAYLHEIRTRFDDNVELNVPYAIAESNEVPNLLGRRGVFDRLQIEFDPRLRVTRIMAPQLDEDRGSGGT